MTAVPVLTNYQRRPALGIRERLLGRLEIHPDGHLLWTGRIHTTGYGRMNVQGQVYLVHRLMYQMFVGPIPEGHEVDHRCRVRHCASPAHLEAVTHRINTLRSTGPSALNAAKSHCDRGHEYDLLNTYFTPQGTRQCRACKQESERNRAPRATVAL